MLLRKRARLSEDMMCGWYESWWIDEIEVDGWYERFAN
jgi:hypothetical protein